MRDNTGNIPDQEPEQDGKLHDCRAAPSHDTERTALAPVGNDSDQCQPPPAGNPRQPKRLGDRLRSVYLRIGVHTAPPGTLCHSLNATARAIFHRSRAVVTGESYELAELPDRRQGFVLAFRISGGIGDHLISARYIRDLLSVIGDIPFDVYSSRPAAARWIFASFPHFRKLFKEHQLFGTSALKHYRASFWLMSFVELLTGSDERLDTNEGLDTQQLVRIRKRIADFNAKIRFFIDIHPRLDGYLAEIALRHGWTRMTFLQGVSGIGYGGDALDLTADRTALDTFGLNGKAYITIHNGFDSEESERIGSSGTTTKSYPYFAEVVAFLRRQLKGLTIVQIGTVTSTPIPGVHINLVNRTTIEQVAEIIKHSVMHVDGESGIVHLAACLGVRSCVIFGPTSQSYFAYDYNLNIPPSTCGNCWWMTPEWLKQCPRGFNEPRCLSETPPERVGVAIARHLEKLVGFSGREEQAMGVTMERANAG